MFIPGLVSVTFRKLGPREIVGLVCEAGLEAIEWGGDVHVPHGDLEAAREVAEITADAGLVTAAYGSYYRLGVANEKPFEAVAETAVALGAPVIRVWAGEKGSEITGEDERRRIVEESRRIGEIAAPLGLLVAYEHHANTLTDTNESALRLMEEVDHPAVKAYWQPPVGRSAGDCVEGLTMLLPWLTNLHVYQWQGTPVERRPLAEGESVWRPYLDCAAATGRDHFALIEFVRDDRPEALLEDAKALRGWLG